MKIVSENQFSGKTYFYTIASRNQECEVSAIMTKQPSGIVTSPESVRTSTNLATTPESSVQSQLSVSSSCPGSPPPVPPLPLDTSFVPVQPDVPPREDSFAAAAAAAYNKDYDSVKQVIRDGIWFLKNRIYPVFRAR